MRYRKPILIAAALLIALAAGWWFGSPWWTLWRMREAAAAGDAKAVSAYIDYPALRASTRAQLRERVGPLGAALARPYLDALISPAALRLALMKKGDGPSPAELDMVRTGPSEFRLRRGGGSELVFRRHGLGWKLEEISLGLAGLESRRR